MELFWQVRVVIFFFHQKLYIAPFKSYVRCVEETPVKTEIKHI